MSDDEYSDDGGGDIDDGDYTQYVEVDDSTINMASQNQRLLELAQNPDDEEQNPDYDFDEDDYVLPEPYQAEPKQKTMSRKPIIVGDVSDLEPSRQSTITKFEKARVIGARARKIAEGAPLLADFSRINLLLQLWQSNVINPHIEYADLIKFLRHNPFYLNPITEDMSPLEKLENEFIPTPEEFEVANKVFSKGSVIPTEVLDATSLAEVEWQQNRMSLTVLRPMPHGESYEYSIEALKDIEAQHRERYFQK